jgi:hypothetical protein
VWELGEKGNWAGNRVIGLTTREEGAINTRASHFPGFFEPIPGMSGLPDFGKGEFVLDGRPDQRL